MNKYFHEAKLTIEKCRKEWVDVGSLSVMFAHSINDACETAVRGLWVSATNEEFPRDKIKPHHKPLSQVRKIGILNNYSRGSRIFLEQINGMNLDVVKYVKSKAYEDYTKPKSRDKGKNLVDGAENFIKETIQLSENESVVRIIHHKNIELKKDSL